MQHNILIRDDSQEQWLSFSKPQRIYSIASLDQVLTALEQVESGVREQASWAAGWISYEASPAFDSALITHPPGEFPLLWFGLFEKCEPIDLDQLVTSDHVDIFQQSVWSLNSNLPDYTKKIHQIKNEIKDGNTYQVNYTIRQYADLDISAEDAFLGFAANAKYGAFIDTGRFALCSASPELFFQINSNQISSKPMKGTASRGRYLQEDHQFRDTLQASEKNRTENLMIVDMIRNDIGRIADSGSVRVPKLFEVEKYPTVWQMTSTVTAELDASLVDIFRALFPCASITGAPKANTMKIIHQLEPSPRNVYTGTVGFIRPDMSMQFNVAIRTALIDKLYNQAEYGVGGGIVWDSSAEDEYQECLTKSKVLSGQGTFTHELLETLSWSPEQEFFLFDYHLSRLQQSAEYFDFKIDLDYVKKQLGDAVKNITQPLRVRLLVSRTGVVKIQTLDLNQPGLPGNYRVKVAEQAVDSNDIYLYHKTTQRAVYDSFLASYADFDDVLLCNQHDEVTESCIANLVIEIEGKKYTPPQDCGLLNGTYRQYLLDHGELIERKINKQELEWVDKCYLINSVRKFWPIEIEF